MQLQNKILLLFLLDMMRSHCVRCEKKIGAPHSCSSLETTKQQSTCLSNHRERENVSVTVSWDMFKEKRESKYEFHLEDVTCVLQMLCVLLFFHRQGERRLCRTEYTRFGP